MAATAESLIRRLPCRKQKSVLFVTKSWGYGGTEKHLLQLMQSLSESDVRLSILCLARNDVYSQRVNQYVAGHHVDIRFNDQIESGAGLRYWWGWYRALREAQPDVVVFVRCWFWAFPWYVSIIGWLAGISRRLSILHLPAPSVPLRVNGWSMSSIMGRLRRMAHLFNIRLSSLFYTSTICVSNAIREALVRDYRFPAKKTIVIRNGVSLREFDQRRGNETNVRTKLGLSSKEFVLVCAARLDEQKGINVLLEALAKLLNDGVRFKCIIVGDGPLRKQLSEQALALNLCDHVFFEGFQPDVRPYLHAADLFVLTSNREGLPLSVLEAMACGLPCVVTDVGGNAEAVIHGKTGLVASAGSVDQIAAAVAYSARNPQERARMSEMARTRACESFDVVKQMDKIREVLLR